MAIQTLNTIKNWFRTGLKPTQTQFWDTWDSFWHKDEAIPQSNITNLVNTLDNKAEKSQLQAHNLDINAHPNLFTAGDNITITKNVISAAAGVRFGESDNLATGNREFDVAANNFTLKNVNEFNIVGASTPAFITYTRLVTGVFYSIEIPGKWIFMELYNGIPKSLSIGDQLLIRLTIDSIEEEILFTASLLPEGGNTPYYWMPEREGHISVLCNGFYGKTDTSIVKMAVDTGTTNPNTIAYFDDNQLKKGIFDLQSATDGGNITRNSIILDDSYNDPITKLSITGLNVESKSNNRRYGSVGAGGISLNIDNKQANLSPNQLSFSNQKSSNGADSNSFVITETEITYFDGMPGNGGNRLNFKRENGNPNILPTFNFPEKPHGSYTLATLDDITGGGSQDLQSVLDNGNVADENILIGDNFFQASLDDKEARLYSQSLDGLNATGRNVLKLTDREVSGSAEYSFNKTKPAGTYTLATLEDIPAVDSLLPVSNSQSGIVNNTPLQELGGVDKIINGVRIGRGAGTTTDNLVVGDVDSMSLNTTGTYNTAIGSGSLNSNTTGESNTGIGAFALWANTTSNNNIAVGESSLQNLISGAGHNVAVGTGSLSTLVSGIGNTGIGDFALWKASTGTFNTAVGSSSLQKITTTSGNTAIGAAAGQNITGTFNVAVGYLSNGETGTTSTGNYNITMGYQSGRALTSGSNNILIENITNASITSGSNNIIIDSKQKSGVTTGNNNTLIGGWDGAFAPTTSDTVALGTGTGVTRFLSASTGLTTLPTQTNALISADATGKAIITKSYSDNMGAVVNATTSTLSGTALNSAYPSAITGFRVHCLSISGGAIVYEKTTGGWIQYSTTAVTP